MAVMDLLVFGLAFGNGTAQDPPLRGEGSGKPRLKCMLVVYINAGSSRAHIYEQV